ncbi:MAG: hypothetical protein LAP86_22215 [Acidobacteriia bacterium]|nr:hypothetical protein [Terriglobia bacterium]
MRSVGGIHRTRLAASNVHRLFVKEAKRTVQKLGWQVPENDISPTFVGAMPLPFRVPDSFEAAFGYKGNLRFVQFGYTVGSPQFGFSDGGDDLPSDGSLWSWFLHHPVVAQYLPESRYPTLYGKFPSGSQRPTLEQIMRGGVDPPTCHCLLLDRRDRRAYVCERDQAMILFALMEPDEGDAHNVFVDGMLMSPGSEDYKVAPPPGLLDEFRRFMDSRDQSSDGA